MIDELHTNTTSYGYDDDRQHRIDLVLRLERDMPVVDITDDGRPFDPSQMPDTDTWENLESRPIRQSRRLFRSQSKGRGCLPSRGRMQHRDADEARDGDRFVVSPNVRRRAGVSLANSIPG